MDKTRISDMAVRLAEGRWRFALLSLSGVLTGLLLIFPKLGIFQWVTLIPAAAVLLCRSVATGKDGRSIRLKSLYLDGLVFFYTYYLVCFHWFLYLYPLDFIDGMTKGAAIAVVLLAWLGLSLFQAIFGGLVFVLSRPLFNSGICRKFPILRAFSAAGLWAVFEWSQTIGWWGVPWGRLPIGQSEYLVGLQNISLFGSYIVTFVLVLVNFLIAFVVIHPTKLKLGVIAVLSALVFQYGSGTALWLLKDTNKGDELTVACIQGNIPSAEKWDDNSLTKTLDNYESLTVEAAKMGAELVVWPETAFPYDITEGYFEFYSDYFARMSDELEIYLLVGAFSGGGEAFADGEDVYSYNSLICFTPDGRRIDNFYSKRHLVPFGEYIPLEGLIRAVAPPLAELVLSNGVIDQGEGAQIIELENGASLGCLICFDSIYEELTLESVREGANIICLSTNDSWFTDSAALDMHNAQAQLRAIESGRYVARAANTGISSFIDPRGEILERTLPLTEALTVQDAYLSGERTLYSYIGNSFVYLLILGNGALLALRVFELCKKKRKIND